VSYDPAVTDRPITLQLDGVTIRQAIDCIMATSRLSYKLVDECLSWCFGIPATRHTRLTAIGQAITQFDSLHNIAAVGILINAAALADSPNRS
jgi:hypothetical protein